MHDSDAIILSRNDHREADLLYALYTEAFGLIRAAAPGVRKPAAKLAGHLETLTRAGVSFVPTKSGWRLIGAIQAEPYRKLNRDLSRRRRAERAAAFLEKTTFAEKDSRIWETLVAFLETLDRRSGLADLPIAEIWLYLKIFSHLGYQVSEDETAARDSGLRKVLAVLESGSLQDALEGGSFPAMPEVSRVLNRSAEFHLGVKLGLGEP